MSEVEETPRSRRPWRRRLFWLGLILALAVLIIAVPVGYFRWCWHNAEQDLQTAVAELDALEPGWKFLELESKRENIPDEQNGALCVQAARAKMPSSWPEHNFLDAYDKAFADLKPNVQLNDSQVTLLRNELSRQEEALSEVRRLPDLEYGRNDVPYREVLFKTPFRHLQPTREIAHLCRYDSLLRAQDGDIGSALASCHATINAGRSIGDEPIFASQLVRLACVSVALTSLERVLAQGEPSEEALASLQRLLEKEGSHPYLLITVRAERAWEHEALRNFENGSAAIEELGGSKPSEDTGPALARHLLRYKMLCDHPVLLRKLTDLAAIAQQPVEDRAHAVSQWHNSILKSGLRPPTLELVANFAGFDDSERLTKAKLRCIIAILATERYRLKHDGRWPHALSDLLPEFLTQIPTDPYDRKPIRYRQNDNGIVIYSVGPDVGDNEGNLSPNGSEPGTDIGFRLWNVNQRRQPAKP
jgi:hypothetical protein